MRRCFDPRSCKYRWQALLQDMRSGDGKTTLMHYIALKLCSRKPPIELLVKEIPHAQLLYITLSVSPTPNVGIEGQFVKGEAITLLNMQSRTLCHRTNSLLYALASLLTHRPLSSGKS